MNACLYVEKSSEKAGIGQISVKNVSTSLLLPGPRLAEGGNSALGKLYSHYTYDHAAVHTKLVHEQKKKKKRVLPPHIEVRK